MVLYPKTFVIKHLQENLRVFNLTIATQLDLDDSIEIGSLVDDMLKHGYQGYHLTLEAFDLQRLKELLDNPLTNLFIRNAREVTLSLLTLPGKRLNEILKLAYSKIIAPIVLRIPVTIEDLEDVDKLKLAILDIKDYPMLRVEPTLYLDHENVHLVTAEHIRLIYRLPIYPYVKGNYQIRNHLNNDQLHEVLSKLFDTLVKADITYPLEEDIRILMGSKKYRPNFRYDTSGTKLMYPLVGQTNIDDKYMYLTEFTYRESLDKYLGIMLHNQKFVENHEECRNCLTSDYCRKTGILTLRELTTDTCVVPSLKDNLTYLEVQQTDTVTDITDSVNRYREPTMRL